MLSKDWQLLQLPHLIFQVRLIGQAQYQIQESKLEIMSHQQTSRRCRTQLILSVNLAQIAQNFACVKAGGVCPVCSRVY